MFDCQTMANTVLNFCSLWTGEWVRKEVPHQSQLKILKNVGEVISRPKLIIESFLRRERLANFQAQRRGPKQALPYAHFFPGPLSSRFILTASISVSDTDDIHGACFFSQNSSNNLKSIKMSRLECCWQLFLQEPDFTEKSWKLIFPQFVVEGEVWAILHWIVTSIWSLV